MSVEAYFALRQTQRCSGGDPDLLDDNVDPGDHFGHWVLDLKTRVHFYEVEFAVFV
ncbi:hypothetical protein MnTg02_00113 [bacterium MnTg02]|nr:hypothetical protein MnTg02_00113 [bacterium MnTg02]